MLPPSILVLLYPLPSFLSFTKSIKDAFFYIQSVNSVLRGSTTSPDRNINVKYKGLECEVGFVRSIKYAFFFFIIS